MGKLLMEVRDRAKALRKIIPIEIEEAADEDIDLPALTVF